MHRIATGAERQIPLPTLHGQPTPTHRLTRSTFLCPGPQVQPFKHHIIEPPSNVVTTSVKELREMYHLMVRMRRMEIAGDMMYKAKLIKGFCHL